ncbi:MAG: hypothetical protein A4E73_03949 [Syntrophaceae bacterium PtaU1.Bin231]|nr:MAG: hypothetical protein A4E73_03949 [Syntrophaceae bacterium PtaU1.Bin231]
MKTPIQPRKDEKKGKAAPEAAKATPNVIAIPEKFMM